MPPKKRKPLSKQRNSVATSNPVVEHDPIWNQSTWRSQVRQRLLKWFDANARTLPWRTNPVPYHVWVSEIMLQQTQVATVLPYFDRFLKSFPTIKKLAAADESLLMKHWEGLGYYRRARSMHAAAKKIVADHDGVFPDLYDSVLALPGIGRYTAGAILSISGDQRLPVLEGNTQRVYSRWIAMKLSPTEKPAKDLLWEVAEKMLPRRKAGDFGPGAFNQAAMELGALVCTPRNPKCDQCPVRLRCCAHRDGLQNQIPGKVTKTKYEDRTEFALVVRERATERRHDQDETDQRYLVRPLPADGRWAGLWDFPRPTESLHDSAAGAGDWLAAELGIAVTAGSRYKTIKHAVTKYRISLHVHEATLERSRKKLPDPWRYVSIDEMADLPMSVTGRQISNFLKSDRQAMLPLQ